MARIGSKQNHSSSRRWVKRPNWKAIVAPLAREAWNGLLNGISLVIKGLVLTLVLGLGSHTSETEKCPCHRSKGGASGQTQCPIQNMEGGCHDERSKTGC